jgi:hypothetical protein
MIPSPDERRSLPEAATRLGVSVGTVRRWLTDGIRAGSERFRPQSVKLGGRIYTTDRWLEDFTAKLSNPAPAPATAEDEERARRASAILAASGW